ncbi:DUF4133 domain-containing protein [Pontibacter qinzhouensis]|uniref:DUF4133 domain-containing protein n=1 Tax=Pontibacter qinzhouensis TaxID=2603253 RepID=A0A5C8J796_9BACT|nr:DUF4133 domain-containing protein [Pontibacter qinzhouensis]TXK33760.1 DUF4133 domain-containing protein [Pontibacter qinzhouensis]
MANSVYPINKGINRPIEFRGLRAQYIGYLAAGLVFLLLLFAGLYLARVPLLLCLPLILLLGFALFTGVYHLNKTYGEHGLLKKFARRSIPRYIRLSTRRTFWVLAKQAEETK